MRKERLRAVLWMIRDTISAASSQAGRASEVFDGEDEAVLFYNLMKELSDYAETSPAMKALIKAPHSPEDKP